MGRFEQWDVPEAHAQKTRVPQFTAADLREFCLRTITSSRRLIHASFDFSPRKAETMRCANPECGLAAHDVTRGTLRLIELDVPPAARVMRSEWGFPICSVPSRYFWLCDKCSQILNIRCWTEEGLIFEHRPDHDQVQRGLPEAKPPARGTHDRLHLMIRQSA